MARDALFSFAFPSNNCKRKSDTIVLDDKSAGDGEKDNSESDAGAGDDDSTDSVLHSVI
jgi:hypothetical protein